jgi:hypothetical protein
MASAELTYVDLSSFYISFCISIYHSYTTGQHLLGDGISHDLVSSYKFYI